MSKIKRVATIPHGAEPMVVDADSGVAFNTDCPVDCTMTPEQALEKRDEYIKWVDEEIATAKNRNEMIYADNMIALKMITESDKTSIPFQPLTKLNPHYRNSREQYKKENPPVPVKKPNVVKLWWINLLHRINRWYMRRYDKQIF